MLDPYARRLVLEALQPPEGYQLDVAIGTTYSLDLVALLAIPLAFSPFAAGEAAHKDPLVLLEALQTSADRITIFCDAGQIYVPPADRLLFAHLEDAVIECVAPRGGAFHPKVWLLRFTEGDERLYRFVCQSRNLTFDRSWDTALVLEGRVHGGRKRLNAPLVDFFFALPSMAVRPMAEERRGVVLELAEQVRRVDWEMPLPFDELAFHPLGHEADRAAWPFDRRIDRMLVVSPFTAASMLDRLSLEGRGDVLISRPDQLDACGPEALTAYENGNTFVLAEEASPDDDLIGLRGLHAKLYLADQGWNATLWTGSANATNAAFDRNVEFLVELHGKRSAVGIDAMLQLDDKSVTFRSLLAPYQASDAPLEGEATRALERQAEDIRRILATSPLTARVVPDRAAPQLFAVRLECPNALPLPASVVGILAWPISRQKASGSTRLILVDELLGSFEQLPLEKVTPFIGFQVTLGQGATELICEFVLNVPLFNAPTDRRAHITRTLLATRGEVLRYLLYLLSDGGIDASRDLDERDGGGGRHSSDRGGLINLPLLESLLRMLDRDPTRLAAVRRVVEDLSETEAGAALLPDLWESVWAPVARLAEELTR